MPFWSVAAILNAIHDLWGFLSLLALIGAYFAYRYLPPPERRIRRTTALPPPNKEHD